LASCAPQRVRPQVYLSLHFSHLEFPRLFQSAQVDAPGPVKVHMRVRRLCPSRLCNGAVACNGDQKQTVFIVVDAQPEPTALCLGLCWIAFDSSFQRLRVRARVRVHTSRSLYGEGRQVASLSARVTCSLRERQNSSSEQS